MQKQVRLEDLEPDHLFTVHCIGGMWQLVEWPEQVKSANLNCRNVKTNEIIKLSRELVATSYRLLSDLQSYIIDTEFGKAAVHEQVDGNYKITFLNTNFHCSVNKMQLEKGQIIDYLYPRVYGFGFGDYYQEGLKDFEGYVEVWKEILKRCYVLRDATIDTRWHDFRIFRKEFKRVAYSKPYIREGRGKLIADDNHFSKDTTRIWLSKEAE